MPKFTALDADPAQLDEHEKNFVATIRKHGWLGTHVAGDKGGPGFSYTTGFWLKFEFPEVVVFSLGRRVAHDTFGIFFVSWRQENALASARARITYLEACPRYCFLSHRNTIEITLDGADGSMGTMSFRLFN